MRPSREGLFFFHRVAAGILCFRRRMLLPILCLIAVSFLLSWFGTYFMIRIAPRLDFVDKPGGRKIHANPKPLGGGVAIFLAFALPLLGILLLARVDHSHIIFWGIHLTELHPDGTKTTRQIQPPSLDPAYWGGVIQKTRLAFAILIAALLLHIMGL